MPKVKLATGRIKHFPYTPAGEKAAAEARKAMADRRARAEKSKNANKK